MDLPNTAYYKKNDYKTKNICKELIDAYENSVIKMSEKDESDLFRDIDIDHLRIMSILKIKEKSREEFEYSIKNLTSIKYLYEDCKKMLEPEHESKSKCFTRMNKKCG